MTDKTYDVDGIVMCESCFEEWLDEQTTMEIAGRMADVIVRYNG